MQPSALRNLHQGPHAFRRVRHECAGLEWARRRAQPVTISLFGLDAARVARWPAHLKHARRALQR